MTGRVVVRLLALILFVVVCAGASAAQRGDEPEPLGGGPVVGPPPSRGPSGARTAATAAGGFALPATPVLDRFDRPNGALGANWVQLASDLGQLTIQSNVARSPSGATVASIWAPAQLGPDSEVYARTIGTGCCQLPKSLRLLLRMRDVGTAGFDGYELMARTSTIGISWDISKYVNRQFTVLREVAADTYSHMLFRAVGSSLEGWGSQDGVNWTLVISTTDTTWPDGGFIGMAVGNTEPAVDDFGGGTLGGTPPGQAQPPEQTYGSFCEGRGSIGNVACATVSDPVNTLTGAFVHAETDLRLAATGVPFEWTRTYTSADAATDRLGPGWTDTYQASLAVQGNGAVIVKGDEGQRFTYPSAGGGQFDTPPGAMATLTTVAGGYRLTTAAQLVYDFDSAGKLVSKKDRNAQGVTLAYDGSGRLQTVTDSASRTATVSYNAAGLVSGVSLSDGRSVSYGYTSGRLTSFTDARGKQWQYGYDGSGRLTTIVDPLGHPQVTNVYDAATGRVTSQTDATSKTTQFAWDAATETATVTDPSNHVWKDVYEGGVLRERIDATNRATGFGFDGDLNGTSVTSPAGETTSMTFDANGNLLTATAPPSLGSAGKTFVYNGRNDPTTVTDARDTVTTYAYTAAGNVESVVQGGQAQASYTYDAQGRALTATDGNGRTTTYTYDPAGNVTSVTQPDPDGPGPLGQPRTTFTYDSQGNVLTRVDPKGNVAGCGCAAQYTTTFTYNAVGQLLTETDQLGHTVTANVYDDAGRHVSTTNANGRTTSFAYDDANRIRTETRPDPDGGGPLAAPVTEYTYDSTGNTLTETDPRGNTTTYAYDNANRLASITAPDPDGASAQTAPVTTFTYDANGFLASTVEPRGNLGGANPNDFRTTFTYDAAGRLRATTDPLGNATTNTYDAVGNLQSVTDANSHTTAYTYDYAGRILTVTAPDPDGGGPLTTPVATYSYDPTGNRLTRRDANNHVTTWTYDGLDRVVSETAPDPDGGGPLSPSLTTTSYDLNGNTLTVTDANGNGTGTSGDGTTVFGYDRADRLASINYSDSTPDVTFTLDDVGNRLTMIDGSGTESRTYDGLDRLLTVTRSGSGLSYAYDAASNLTRRAYPDGTVVDLAYDPLNRLAAVSSGGRTTGYGYDAASNLAATTLPATNGYVENRAYDRAGRLLSVEHQKGATVLADIAWTRDAVGNPLTETRTGAAPFSKTFQYDAMDRLTGVCFQAGTCPGATDPFIRWTYDGVGNRLTEQRPGGTTTYAYDQMDRLLGAGSTSYSYDRNGNQLSAGSRAFTWDLANRLRSTTGSGTTTTYTYDGDGRRLQASTGNGNNQKTNYVWDVTAGPAELVLERSGNNGLVRRYVNGHRPIFMSTSSSNAFYYHVDPLGSVRNVTDSTGATQLTYDYEPFGIIRSQSGTLANVLRFDGQYQDATGLYHLRARQYDPASARFLSADPLEAQAADAISSTYVYASNRPTALGDPTGLQPQTAEAAWTLTALAARPNYTRVHDDIVNQTAAVLRLALPVMRVQGSVTTSRADNRLDGAAANGRGGPGYADMILWLPTSRMAMIWEFKSDRRSGAAAAAQLSGYTRAIPVTHRDYISGVQGFTFPPLGFHLVARTDAGLFNVYPDLRFRGVIRYSPTGGGGPKPPGVAVPVVAVTGGMIARLATAAYGAFMGRLVGAGGRCTTVSCG
jgi:RHS repeat-associated protein